MRVCANTRYQSSTYTAVTCLHVQYVYMRRSSTSFDEILDLTADVFSFYNTVIRVFAKIRF